MKLSEKAQILLERYLLAVEHRLPLQGRKDMIAEIEANLLDTLEDQYTPEEVLTESQLEAELRKLGSPKSVAAGYRTTDALIGPQHNTIFNIIVTIVTPIVVAVTFFAGLLSFVVSGGESPFWSIWGLFGTAWQVAVGIIGTAAIVFMILTRYFPQVNQNNEFTKEFLDDEKTSWKVSDLPQTVRKEDKLQPWEPIAGIVFGSIWLAVFILLFDQLVGFWWMTDDQWHMVPIFTEAFKAYLPWMGVNIALGIILNAILLYSRRRTLVSRWFEVVVKISEIGLVGALLSAGELVKFDPALAIERGFPASGVEGMQTLFQFNFIHWFLIFLLVVMGIDLIKKVIDALKSSAETAGISK